MKKSTQRIIYTIAGIEMVGGLWLATTSYAKAMYYKGRIDARKEITDELMRILKERNEK